MTDAHPVARNNCHGGQKRLFQINTHVPGAIRSDNGQAVIWS